MEFGLIILLAIDKNPEISFYCIILPFSLAINLRIEGNKELFFDF